ncbi:MAG: CxxC-x17-CxxC domain-containing protein [Candidatus Andersenbacteria bacterium]
MDGSSDRPMFDAVCSKCGNETQVPFQPSGDRPVYCSDCFKEMRGQQSGGGGFRREERQMFDATCATCGAATQVPFRPTEGRPVYCREHFKRGE